MKRIAILIGLFVGVTVAAAGGFWLGQGRPWPPRLAMPLEAAASQQQTPAQAQPREANGGKRVLYYRNPMGLADTSPAPKKDWMGMDYIPVFEGEDRADASAIKVSLDRVQRSGVRTELVARRAVTQPVRVPGAVRLDESRVKVVALRFDGYIEELFVNTTGQAVRAGQPLFRVYSQPLQLAQVDLAFALREGKAREKAPFDDRVVESAMVRLRNMGVPESRIEAVRKSGANPRTIDWPSPASGVVLEKKVLEGQRVQAGDELYRIADIGTVWVIAEVPEQELPNIRLGDRVAATFLAFPGESWEGRVVFVYPDLKAETRTARVRIELPNPDGRLRLDMYADVTMGGESHSAPVIAIPDHAVIDSGARQVVLIAKGDGRFEPRPVKLGRRGGGFIEVREGLREGEEIVTAANFLIDAESNLRAALQGIAAPQSGDGERK